jgi:hypothetical protein
MRPLTTPEPDKSVSRLGGRIREDGIAVNLKHAAEAVSSALRN